MLNLNKPFKEHYVNFFALDAFHNICHIMKNAVFTVIV